MPSQPAPPRALRQPPTLYNVESVNGGAPRHFVFVLLDRFTLMSFAAAIEPLRLANRVSGRELYRWTILAEHQTAACSNGAEIRADRGLDHEPAASDTVIICGGIDVQKAISRAVLSYLRRAARARARLGALCTGAWVLAKLGLLDGRRATIHWENHDAMAEAFPDVTLIRSVFIEDGNRVTAAGGSAAADLMISLIARDHGAEMAMRIADQLIHGSVRSEGDAQRLSIPSRLGVRHPHLSSVIARMEANLEDPISPSILAADAGISMRQLERLFARYLNRTPKQYYMDCRLARAKNLLTQTEMPVLEVALACGFSGTAHFSKCYRAQYGRTPFRERGATSYATTPPEPSDSPKLAD